MKNEVIVAGVMAFSSCLLLGMSPAANADEMNLPNGNVDGISDILCTHDNTTLEVRLLNERTIELVYSNSATAELVFQKQVQPNGQIFFQYKGKTTGLDFKTTTAYLSPDHSVLLLPHSDCATGTYIQYSCQAFEASQ